MPQFSHLFFFLILYLSETETFEKYFAQTDDITMEGDQYSLSSDDPVILEEGSMNGNPETEYKENTNGTTTVETQAGRCEINKHNAASDFS